VFSDCEVFESKKQLEAFERLVGRTYLEHAATQLTKALDDFAGAYRKMKAVRPSDVDRGQLKKFAEQAYRASTSADELAVALEKFIKEAAARGRGGSEKVDQGSRGSSRALSVAAPLASRWRRILSLITRSARARSNDIIWSCRAALASSRSLSQSSACYEKDGRLIRRRLDHHLPAVIAPYLGEVLQKGLAGDERDHRRRSSGPNAASAPPGAVLEHVTHDRGDNARLSPSWPQHKWW
jgi:hypothetical protein